MLARVLVLLFTSSPCTAPKLPMGGASVAALPLTIPMRHQWWSASVPCGASFLCGCPSHLMGPHEVVYVPPAPTSTLSIATWCSRGLGGAACSRVPPVGILPVLGKKRRLTTTAGRHALVIQGASRACSSDCLLFVRIDATSLRYPGRAFAGCVCSPGPGPPPCQLRLGVAGQGGAIYTRASPHGGIASWQEEGDNHCCRHPLLFTIVAAGCRVYAAPSRPHHGRMHVPMWAMLLLLQLVPVILGPA
jgi:hypothetical protein